MLKLCGSRFRDKFVAVYILYAVCVDICLDLNSYEIVPGTAVR
jgi:hypothetical protein